MHRAETIGSSGVGSTTVVNDGKNVTYAVEAILVDHGHLVQ